MLRVVYRLLCKIEVVICGTGFFALVMLVFISAILRAFRLSMAWTMDVAMLLLAWTAFLGADVAYRDGKLVGINLATRALPIKVQKVIQILVFFSILVLLGIIIIYGIKLADFEALRKYQSIPIPYSVLTMSIVVPAASMVVSTIIKLKRCFLTFNKTEETPKGNKEV